MHLMTAFLTLVKDSDRVSSSSTLLSTYAAVFFPQSHQMLADKEQVDQHCHALASRDDQDRQHPPPTIAAATCIAPLAINKGFLSKSKLRTPSLFFYQSGDWCRESIFYIIVTTILSIQWKDLLQGLCSVRESAPEQHHKESLQHVLHTTALPWSRAFRQSSSQWNSSVHSLATAPA